MPWNPDYLSDTENVAQGRPIDKANSASQKSRHQPNILCPLQQRDLSLFQLNLAPQLPPEISGTQLETSCGEDL
jgi:hypothetical protein